MDCLCDSIDLSFQAFYLENFIVYAAEVEHRFLLSLHVYCSNLTVLCDQVGLMVARFIDGEKDYIFAT